MLRTTCGMAMTAWGLMVLASQAAETPSGPTWLVDYGQALTQAEAKRQPLLVYFPPQQPTETGAKLEKQTLADPQVQAALGKLTLVRTPLDTQIKVAGQQITLAQHPAFARLAGQPGFAVVDTTDSRSSRFRQVVDVWPAAADGSFPGANDLTRFLSAAAQSSGDAPAVAKAADPKPTASPWHADYAAAYKQAAAEKKYLLILFQDGASSPFEEQVLADGNLRQRLEKFVLAKLPTDYQANLGAETVRLLGHQSFQYMYGRGGLCIVDLANAGEAQHGHVVSAHPFGGRIAYDAFRTAAILDLPPGTLTQRTMIFAVRTHGEQPQSTHGEYSRQLAAEAESHSAHQASINNQGHHNWDSRFQRISASLPGGLRAQEVCAESWPGQELVDAAVECVHSWRQSSGHWNAVRRHQPLFGYDLKPGARGIWYGTGIFGNR